LTLDREPGGTYDICPVCFWEDDAVQFDDHDYEGGANIVSLHEARKNFLEFGASEKQFLKDVRAPRPDEVNPENPQSPTTGLE
jgi:Cysteine-rich CPCC